MSTALEPKHKDQQPQAAGLKSSQGIKPETAIAVAMADPEQWALRISYRDKQDRKTVRFVSPIRFLAQDRFLALCLCREEPRQFNLERCDAIDLIPSSALVMPLMMH